MTEILSNACSILDMPDEILVKIISHFNVRKRLVIAKTCTRFNALVFGDKELSRDLNFSKKGRLTKASEIREYFQNENLRSRVRKVNIQNVYCMAGGKRLINTIGKAINLVDINVHNTEFRSLEQLVEFLEPLINLKRLSVDWTERTEYDLSSCLIAFQKPLSRLTYLSVEVSAYSGEFLPCLQLCQNLEELRVVLSDESSCWVRTISWNLDEKKLEHLKIVQVRGRQAIELLRKYIVDMLPKHHEWTDFQLVDLNDGPGFYLERHIEVCDELQKTGILKDTPYFLQPGIDFQSNVIADSLLNQVIKITHYDVPENFCCLTPSYPYPDLKDEAVFLKIEDAKKLLKDPTYSISSLNFRHFISPDCDVHLVASAFPNLTELVLSNVVKTQDGVFNPRKKQKTQHNCQRRLKRRNSEVPEKENDRPNLDSSFKMLVDNTPHLKTLIMYGTYIHNNDRDSWNLKALHLISNWKNLTTLRLGNIPIRNGKFLIDIGKQCPKLETLFLFHLGPSYPCCYTKDLIKMLTHCRNLKDFSIEQSDIDIWLPNLLASLSSNLGLRKVRVINWSEDYELSRSVGLIETMEVLLHCCSKLTTFVFIMCAISAADSNEITEAVEKFQAETNRLNFQFQGPEVYMDRTVYDDAPPTFFPSKLNESSLSFM